MAALPKQKWPKVETPQPPRNLAAGFRMIWMDTCNPRLQDPFTHPLLAWAPQPTTQEILKMNPNRNPTLSRGTKRIPLAGYFNGSTGRHPLKRLGWWLVAIGTVAAAETFHQFRLPDEAWKLPRVVKIESKKPLASLFPAWMAWLSDAEEGVPQGLLLRDGDFVFGEDVAIPYRASDGQAIKLIFSDWRAQIGETTVSVLLDKDEGLAWLHQASERDLANLRMVSLPTVIGVRTLATLKRLAAVNPQVNLRGESEAAMLQALPLFQPRAVFLGNHSGAVLRALAKQPELETLQMEASEPGSFAVLPTLPKLRRLIIGGWDVTKVGPLPADLPSLKTLLILDGNGLRDLTALGALPPGLEELSLLGLNDLNDLTGIDKLTRLRTLVLWGNEKLGDLSSLAALTQLRWVGLPPKTDQEQFAAFASTHPKLKILDLSGNKTVQDLAPLSAMKGLEGLILEGPYKNLDAVRGLTSLRFLGISKEASEAAQEQIAAVRKALPDALVVRVKPICLGSGWILLLVPVLVGVWLVRRQPQRVAQSA